MTEFERKCVENIPPDELRRITDEVMWRTARAYEQPGLHVDYCTECERMYRREHLMKTPCVVDVYRGVCICSYHFARELEEQLCKEYLEAHKQKEPFPVAELRNGGLVPLDVEDFARI